ncbi:SIS domain-containing protein [Desulfovibrio sp. QI0430]
MHDTALDIIEQHASEGARLREDFFRSQADFLRQAALRAATCLAGGGKILLCGNGGSAALAQHMAAEFVNRFFMDRPALPALALSADATSLTAIGSDLDFSQVFSRQIEALGRPGDMLVAIFSTGSSANIIAALEAARRGGQFAVCLCGHGSEMALYSDMVLEAPQAEPALVQELHLAAGHLFCRLTDYYLFENAVALTPYLQGRHTTEV